MKIVTKYQSDDGKLHDTEIEAAKADAAFYKDRARRAEARARVAAMESGMEPGYDVHDGNGHM